MSQASKVRKRAFHFKYIRPVDPEVRHFDEWLPENRGFYAQFRQWLKDIGYGEVAVKLYCVAGRQLMGYLNKPYWTIDPEADLQRAWEHLSQRPLTASTLSDYHKGLLRLEEYLRLRCHRPAKPKTVNWAYYIGSLPGWLQADIREFLLHLQRNWRADRQAESRKNALSRLSGSLRWMTAHFPFDDIQQLNPQTWYAYLDERLAAGIAGKSLNAELSCLKHFVLYLKEHDRQVCERFLLVDYLDEGKNLPKDVPMDQLRMLQQAIQQQGTVAHTGLQRLGHMDLAWFLLMLQSGLRTCEVRNLRLKDIDWESQRARIEQSKNMKDRIIFLSQATIDALKAYLEVRGVPEALSDHVFVFRHAPLSSTYCFERLRTYCKPLGIHVAPHQLRHSCATLLLNSGAPVLTVQTLLGHKWVDTTLGYARLYDGTVAADYYQAMSGLEKRLALPEDKLAQPANIGQLLAMVDALHQGTLNESQINLVQQLRAGLMTLTERENFIDDVKVLTPVD